jgi:hypothetical protein
MSRNPLCKASITRLLAKPAVHIALILLSGVFAYANTFNVPFLFDDIPVILDNYLIKNISNLWPPSGTRWFGSLTFALNYAAGGAEVSGYHIVNLGIHLAASLLVYCLVNLTFRTPLFHTNHQRAICNNTIVFAPFAAAYLFASHPIQTQAVTYIVQRFASLATLLFLASIICYIQARLSHLNGDSENINRRRTIAWYIAALLWAVLAMKTKEIAFTLPLVVVLYEYAFIPRRPLRERLYFIIPIASTMFIIPFALSSEGPNGISIISSASNITRHDYLLTQFRVIVTYLRLLIFPINQMIDYDYPISVELSSPPVFLSLSLISTLFLASFIFLLKGRKAFPELCIAGFGGLWFFITLSVESSVIPIQDVIFEHRLYLPAAGVFMAAAVLGAVALERVRPVFPRVSGGVCAIIVLIFVALPLATRFRNKVWRSGTTLWEDVLNKSPGHARALVNIGIGFVERGNIDKGLECFKEAVRIKPNYSDAIVDLGNAYLEKGMFEESYQQYQKALTLGDMNSEGRAMLMVQIGNYHLMKNETDRAIYLYKNSLSMTPNVAMIHYNLGRAYEQQGMPAEATHEFAQARLLNPERY